MLNSSVDSLKSLTWLVRENSKEPEQLFRLVRFISENDADITMLLNFFDQLMEALKKKGCAYPTLEIEVSTTVDAAGRVFLGVEFYPTELLALKRSEWRMALAWITPGKFLPATKDPRLNPDDCPPVETSPALIPTTIQPLVSYCMRHFFGP